MNVIYSITNRTSSLVRGIIFLILGIALIIWPVAIVSIIVKIIAAILIVISAISLVMTYNGQKREVSQEKSPLSYFALGAMVVSLIFGILIFAFPTFFTGLLVFLFGVVLLLLGIAQISNLVISAKHAKVPFWLYISPALITIAGIICFFQPQNAAKSITIFFGAMIVLYALMELLSSKVLKNVKFGKDGEYIEVKSELLEE